MTLEEDDEENIPYTINTSSSHLRKASVANRDAVTVAACVTYSVGEMVYAVCILLHDYTNTHSHTHHVYIYLCVVLV